GRGVASREGSLGESSNRVLRNEGDAERSKSKVLLTFQGSAARDLRGGGLVFAATEDSGGAAGGSGCDRGAQRECCRETGNGYVHGQAPWRKITGPLSLPATPWGYLTVSTTLWCVVACVNPADAAPRLMVDAPGAIGWNVQNALAAFAAKVTVELRIVPAAGFELLICTVAVVPGLSWAFAIH